MLLETINLNLKGGPGAVKKLQAKRAGPYTITKKVSLSAYKLRLPRDWKIHPVFNESLLTPFVESEVKDASTARPPPDEIEGEEEYEVEKIIDSICVSRPSEPQLAGGGT